MARSFWRILIPRATVFLSSGCIAVLAMVALRMTAAELGTSFHTWTAVLTTTFVGLALGSLLGGFTAERFHARRTLSVLFALSSATCVLVVILNNMLRDWTGLWALPWPVHILLHVGLLLLLPTVLLAAVAPVAGKIASGDGTAPGRVMGAVLTWAACGGAVGLLMAGLYLIPTYGNAAAAWSISVVTLALAFLCWISCWVLYVWGMIFGVLLLLVAAPAPWAVQSGTAAYLRAARGADVLYEGQTAYSLAIVRQTSQRPDTRVLWLDAREQGTVLPADATYIRDFPPAVVAAIMQGLFRSGDSPSVLFLGSGGCVLPRYVRTTWPQSYVRVVEPDTGATAAATAALAPDLAVETIHVDAAAYVNMLRMRQIPEGSDRRCDLIYAQFTSPFDVPFCLVTRQFNDKLSSLLSQKGVYIVSVADAAEKGQFVGAVINTLEQTFPNVQVIAQMVDHPAAIESLVVVAGWRRLDLPEMLGSYVASPRARVLDSTQIYRIKNRASGIILTDDRAPVEALLTSVAGADASLQLARKRLRQAVLLENQGQGEQSDVLYRQVASVDTPARVDAYAAIGRRRLSSGDLDRAGEAFNAALKCAIENGAPEATVAQLHAELAGVVKKVNRPRPAEQHIAAAVEGFQAEVRRHPRSVVAWEHLGDALAFQGNLPGASDAYSRCIELEPDYVTHYDKLTNTLEKQGRYEEAVKVIRAQIVVLKKTGRKEAIQQLTEMIPSLEYQRVRQPR